MKSKRPSLICDVCSELARIEAMAKTAAKKASRNDYKVTKSDDSDNDNDVDVRQMQIKAKAIQHASDLESKSEVTLSFDETVKSFDDSVRLDFDDEIDVTDANVSNLQLERYRKVAGEDTSTTKAASYAGNIVASSGKPTKSTKRKTKKTKDNSEDENVCKAKKKEEKLSKKR